MSDRYVLTVPRTYKSGGEEKTSYTRVGSVFVNNKKDSGEEFLRIKLDFPVAVEEMVAFRPNDKTIENGHADEEG